jgi:aconitate hydratase
VAAAIYDPVTTTDELIPSGETSSYRSNPLKLAEFTLSRKDPEYVPRAKEVRSVERLRQQNPTHPAVQEILAGYDAEHTGLGTLVMAMRPGDGSAREQAASCQRVLGGVANLAEDYATKRYRSNLVNWGMLPLVAEGLEKLDIEPGNQLYIPGIRALLASDRDETEATLIQDGRKTHIILHLPRMSREERDIILAGCLINYYAK